MSNEIEHQHPMAHETRTAMAPEPEPEPRAETDGVSGAVLEAQLARRSTSAEGPDRRYGRGVEWVRPTDLIARKTSQVAGRGIDLQADLSRRARLPATAGMRRVSDRARRLPPVSAFGRGHTTQGPTRSGVGMS